MLLSGLWFELASILVPVSSLSMRLVLCSAPQCSFSGFSFPSPPSFLTSQLRCCVWLVLVPCLHKSPLPTRSSSNDGGSQGSAGWVLVLPIRFNVRSSSVLPLLPPREEKVKCVSISQQIQYIQRQSPRRDRALESHCVSAVCLTF